MSHITRHTSHVTRHTSHVERQEHPPSTTTGTVEEVVAIFTRRTGGGAALRGRTLTSRSSRGAVWACRTLGHSPPGTSTAAASIDDAFYFQPHHRRLQHSAVAQSRLHAHGLRALSVNRYIMTRRGRLMLELFVLATLLQLLRNPHEREHGRNEPQHVDLRNSRWMYRRGSR